MKSLVVIFAFCCSSNAELQGKGEEEQIVTEAQRIILRETNSPKAAFGLGKIDLATEDDFGKFVADFGRKYKDKKERRLRLRTFRINMFIAKALQKAEQGSAVYGPTKFADIPVAEFKSHYRNPHWDLTKKPDKIAEIPTSAIPDSFDWRQKGAVTPVKNQKSCGSCWAFSTTGNIEGQWFIKKKHLVSLSEQELVDCDKVDDGCNGGLPSQAYKEIIRLGGLESEKKYPYKARDQRCSLNKSMEVVCINSSVLISSNETEMAAWCAAKGPMSIGINAMGMQFYRGGISHPWKMFCSPSHLDHGVLIVGYGVREGEPYWIVKNSWGEDWGEHGYYLIYRGSGACGLNKMVTSAVIY